MKDMFNEENFKYVSSTGSGNVHFEFKGKLIKVDLIKKEMTGGDNYRDLKYNLRRRGDSELVNKLNEIIKCMLFENPDIIRKTIINCDRNLGFIINNEKFYLACPSDIGLEEDCSLSCEECFSKCITYPASLKKYGFSSKDMLNVNIGEQIKEKNIKSKVLKDLKEDKLEFPYILKGEEKSYVLCPPSIFMEKSRTCKGILNEGCKECWKNARKEYLEGEE